MISTDEEAFKIKPFVEKNQYVVPVLYSDGKVEAAYKIIGTPTTYVIDRQGVVQLKHIGYTPGAEVQFRKKLDELLGPERGGQ